MTVDLSVPGVADALKRGAHSPLGASASERWINRGNGSWALRIPRETAPEAAPYGYCPYCGKPGNMRERRPNGDDSCPLGHRYRSTDALEKPNGR